LCRGYTVKYCKANKKYNRDLFQNWHLKRTGGVVAASNS
jgi:hypothetical protein